MLRFKQAVEQFLLPFLEGIDYIAQRTNNGVIINYNKYDGAKIIFTKRQNLNSFSCLLIKVGSRLLIYPFRLLIFALGTDEEKKNFYDADDYFYYDTDEELIATLTFIGKYLKVSIVAFFDQDLEIVVNKCYTELVMKRKSMFEHLSNEEADQVAREHLSRWYNYRFKNVMVNNDERPK
jgi:hypothetical protein